MDFPHLETQQANTLGEFSRAKDETAANLKQMSDLQSELLNLQSKLAHESSARIEVSAAFEELQAELDGLKDSSTEEIASLQHELEIMHHIRQEQEIVIDELRNLLTESSSEQVESCCSGYIQLQMSSLLMI